MLSSQHTAAAPLIKAAVFWSGSKTQSSSRPASVKAPTPHIFTPFWRGLQLPGHRSWWTGPKRSFLQQQRVVQHNTSARITASRVSFLKIQGTPYDSRRGSMRNNNICRIPKTAFSIQGQGLWPILPDLCYGWSGQRWSPKLPAPLSGRWPSQTPSKIQKSNKIHRSSSPWPTSAFSSREWSVDNNSSLHYFCLGEVCLFS